MRHPGYLRYWRHSLPRSLLSWQDWLSQVLSLHRRVPQPVHKRSERFRFLSGCKDGIYRLVTDRWPRIAFLHRKHPAAFLLPSLWSRWHFHHHREDPHANVSLRKPSEPMTAPRSWNREPSVYSSSEDSRKCSQEDYPLYRLLLGLGLHLSKSIFCFLRLFLILFSTSNFLSFVMLYLLDNR